MKGWWNLGIKLVSGIASDGSCSLLFFVIRGSIRGFVLKTMFRNQKKNVSILTCALIVPL